MIRWLFVIFLALLVFSILIPELRKLGVGRVPGDYLVRIFGRTLLLPFGSTVVIFAVVLLVAELQKLVA
jgi:multisubunit Na+/H+ antiporter MnhG subunit